MNPMNPIFLQKQIRENASDLQDFCKDLQDWGETMKRKEELLKNPDGEKTGQNSKVRKIHKTEKKAPRKETVTNKPVSKLGATDYSAWDKFDADAECEKLEDDIKDDSELTDECNEKQDEAIIEKEKGNKFVRNQNWDEAIKCYTKAIECYSFDPIFYANRALCYIKKNKFKEAEKDCTLSIKLDSTYVKAYQRRAAAKEGLERFDEAEYDILRALELEPKNKECSASLERIRKRLGKSEKSLEQRPISKFTASRNKVTPPDKQPLPCQPTDTGVQKIVDTSKPVSIWPEQNDNIILVKPINKPPHLRSQKPMKRIEITEIDNQTEIKTSKSRVSEEPEAIKKHIVENIQIEEQSSDAPKVVSNFKKRQMERSLDKSENLTALPRPGEQIECLKSDDFKVVENKSIPSGNQLSNISKEVKNTSNINISNSNKMCVEQNENDINLSVPKTSVQFYLTWKNLKNSEDKYKYLTMIPPQDLPKIFLESLESNIFSNILEVLVKHFAGKESIFDILHNLAQVKRFGTIVMFKTASDVNNLWKLFDFIKEIEQKNKEDVDTLIKKYEL